MNPEVKKKWLEKLRSGTLSQLNDREKYDFLQISEKIKELL